MKLSEKKTVCAWLFLKFNSEIVDGNRGRTVSLLSLPQQSNGLAQPESSSILQIARNYL